MNETKQTIRKKYLAKRRSLSHAQQINASQHICLLIQELPLYQHAKRIALYQAIDREIDVSFLWKHALQHGKICYMPSMQKDHTLLFIEHSPSDLSVVNTFGIYEPLTHKNKTIFPEHLDLMILPVVAFDQYGTRLGRGAGYYDKALAAARPKHLLGVAYAFQQYPHLPSASWDIPLDGTVTEETIIWSRTSAKR